MSARARSWSDGFNAWGYYQAIENLLSINAPIDQYVIDQAEKIYAVASREGRWGNGAVGPLSVSIREYTLDMQGIDDNTNYQVQARKLIDQAKNQLQSPSPIAASSPIQKSASPKSGLSMALIKAGLVKQ